MRLPHFVNPERRSTLKFPPPAPLPLDHLDPQTPQLSQLVSQWQKLWLLALARQKHLEQHRQKLIEVSAFLRCQYETSSPLEDSNIDAPIVIFFLVSYFGVSLEHKPYVFAFSEIQIEEFANFDFNIWRKRYIQWISHLKSRILDVFRNIDRDQDGRISQKEFIDYVLASSKTRWLLQQTT